MGLFLRAQHLLCLRRVESRPGWGQSHCGNWLTLALSHRPLTSAHGAHCHRCPSVRGREEDGRDRRQSLPISSKSVCKPLPTPRRALWVHFRTPAFPDPLPASCPDHSSSPLITRQERELSQQVQSRLVFSTDNVPLELKIQWNII